MMDINKKVKEMIRYQATVIEINPELYKELNEEVLELIKAKRIKIEITKSVKTVCMYRPKTDCYAYIKNDTYRGCFCLKELYCKNGQCRFYQERRKAKKKYLDNYSVNTASLIARNIDKYFRSL